MARPRRLTALAGRILERSSLPDGPTAVALSGGADSAVCAWAAREAGAQVRALHVHHGLAASDRLAAAAREVAERLDLPFESLWTTVPSGPSPEGQARAVRYRELVGALEPGEWLLTGHTADDQAETVLLDLLRGGGTDALAGMPPRRHPLARPLLQVWRSETRELAALLGLPWHDDPTNTDPGLFRNRIRLSLLPTLEGQYAAGLRERLVRNAELRRAEREVLDRLAGHIRVETSEGAARIARGELLAADPVIAARRVRDVLSRLVPDLHPSRSLLEQVVEGARNGVRVSLPGAQARVAGPWLLLEAERLSRHVPDPVVLRPPGVVRWGRFRFEATLTEERPLMPLTPWGIVMPVSGEPVLGIRPPLPEDRVALREGAKRVSAALREAVPDVAEREAWPVVEMGGRVVWVPGVRRVPVGDGGDARYLSAVASEEPEWESAP